MAFIAITVPSVGDPTRLDTFAAPMAANMLYLYGAIPPASTNLLNNGSFEANVVSNAAPSGWTLTTLGTTNTCQTETSAANTRHGKQAFSMTTPGSVSGGVVITSGLGICSESEGFGMRWLMKSSVATITNAVQVSWYDQAGVFISTTNVWSASSGNATSWQPFVAPLSPPAGARQFAVILTGVNSTTAGTVYWDGIEVFPVMRGNRAAVFLASGVFVWPADCDSVTVEALGGGGGGGGAGGADSSSANNGVAGSNGGSSYFSSATYLARGGNGGAGSLGAVGSSTAGATQSAGMTPVISSNGFQFGALPSTGAAGTGTSSGGGNGAASNQPAYPMQSPSLAGGVGKTIIGTGNAGGSGQANTGQAGAGGGGVRISSAGSGGGASGNPGEWAKWMLTTAILGDNIPGTSVTVNVGGGGAGGAGGTASSTGGAGGTAGSGYVIVYY